MSDQVTRRYLSEGCAPASAIDRGASGQVAKWWVCTKPLDQGGEKISGPFLKAETAIEERNRIERQEHREDLWVHEDL